MDETLGTRPQRTPLYYVMIWFHILLIVIMVPCGLMTALAAVTFPLYLVGFIVIPCMIAGLVMNTLLVRLTIRARLTEQPRLARLIRINSVLFLVTVCAGSIDMAFTVVADQYSSFEERLVVIVLSGLTLPLVLVNRLWLWFVETRADLVDDTPPWLREAKPEPSARPLDQPALNA